MYEKKSQITNRNKIMENETKRSAMQCKAILGKKYFSKRNGILKKIKKQCTNKCN